MLGKAADDGVNVWALAVHDGDQEMEFQEMESELAVGRFFTSLSVILPFK